jgi:hypothetical protein
VLTVNLGEQFLQLQEKFIIILRETRLILTKGRYMANKKKESEKKYKSFQHIWFYRFLKSGIGRSWCNSLPDTRFYFGSKRQ